MITRAFKFRFWLALLGASVCALFILKSCSTEPPTNALPNVQIEAYVPELDSIAPSRRPSAKFAADSPVTALNETSRYHHDLETRLNAISNLVGEAPAEAAPVLQAQLDDALPAVREEAVEALSVLGGPEGVAGLAYAMSDESSTVRRLAIEGLASLHSDEAINALALALSETDPGLRELAIEGLADIGTDNALAVLQSFLSDPDSDVAELAAEYVMR